MRKIFALLFTLAGIAAAQSARPPVVFVRGYDFNWLLRGFCTPSDPSDTFGSLPSQIQADGAAVYGFDNCAAAGLKNVPIETLGALFGQFLATVPGPEVDVVAHSMGGLIVRAYLAGLQTGAILNPPQNPRIRKIVFIATPHFGAVLANTTGTDAEIMEMAMGSAFLYNLGRWNQGTDDLRGIDSLAIVGNSGSSGVDDGVVTLNSGSLLSFSRPALRTRVLPYCHTSGLAFLGACSGDSIATAPETSTMVRSFLSGTNDWMTVGKTIVNGTGSTGGLFLTARDANDLPYDITSVTFNATGGTLDRGPAAYFKDLLSPVAYPLNIKTSAGNILYNVTVQPAQFVPALAKAPPMISAVIPSAGLSDARVVAPGELVSFYGNGLAASTVQSSGLPYPVELGGTVITSGSTVIPLLGVSDGQVNAYIPPSLNGLVNVTIKNSIGQHTTTLLVAPSAPTLFSLSNSGSGPAAALRQNGSVIGAGNAATVGEYISLYATGLGATTVSNGLDVAVLAPQVTVGGVAATVTFAGRAPGLVGLDQINVQIPTGLSGASVPVIVISGGRTSNTVTVAVQ